MISVERFEKYWMPEPNSGCWLWTGGPYKSGRYGMFSHIRAHRASWILFKGEIPSGMCVLHHCDTPFCVNPDHLYIGTQAENCKDRAVRKRGKEHRQFGEDNDNAKLTLDQVRQIRASNLTLSATAKLFGISTGHVWKIKQHWNWDDKV